MLRLALYWGILGLAAGPIAIYCLILLALYLDPACRAADANTCSLDAGLNLVLGAVGGFVLFFAGSLLRSALRRTGSE
ncbi:MAG: hypothetical protein JJ913_00100 [Rhizobiaceae bacterium]|nr:hypothetical protein [Rhizobiaceae bacterium]